MSERIVNVVVKLVVKDDDQLSEEAIHDIVDECDYEFKHERIIDTEIIDILEVK